ncbi:NAD(P)-binding protein [Paramyrothecium foliicola]|nr:NAD(P)-binding protein [Paramyrothecium foliicola]
MRDWFRQVFEGNVFGVAAVTDASLPLMGKSMRPDRRIVNVSSGIGLIAVAGERGYEFDANAWYVPEYRSSKAALSMITVAQSVRFADNKTAVIAGAPGAKSIVRTAAEGDSRKLSSTFVAGEPHSAW